MSESTVPPASTTPDRPEEVRAPTGDVGAGKATPGRSGPADGDPAAGEVATGRSPSRRSVVGAVAVILVAVAGGAASGAVVAEHTTTTAPAGHLVTARAAIPANTDAPIDAHCPPGQEALGGGASTSAVSARVQVADSFPEADPGATGSRALLPVAWHAFVINGSPDPVNAAVVVTCAPTG